MRIHHVIAISIAVGSNACIAANSYDEASAQGKADSLNPAYRSWYLKEMRPAFGPAFLPLLNQCTSTVPPEALANFGVVFTVTSTGSIKQTFWKTENSLSSCVERNIRSLTFPPAPKDEFFFGLEIQLAPR